MIKRTYSGVITKTRNGFEIFTHKSCVNFSEELETYWKQGMPVRMVVYGDIARKLLDVKDDEIRLDRDNRKQYKYFIKDTNIDLFLEKNIGKLLYIDLFLFNNEVEQNETNEG